MRARFACLPVSPYRLASHRFASRPASRVDERGDVVFAGVCGLLFLSVRCGIESAAAVRVACLVMSAMSMMRCVDSVGVVPSSWPWFP